MRRFIKVKYIYGLLLLMLVVACQKDEVGPQFSNGEHATLGIRRVYVLNEGNFNWGNASLSVYNPDTKEVNNRFFESVNDYALGDVAQSMTIQRESNRAYIVVNNSSKIEVVDLNDFSSLGTIIGFNSPRYMVFSNAETAYVSDLYDNHIYKVNAETMEISKRIAADGWTEDLWYQDKALYVLNKGAGQLWVLNTTTDVWDNKFDFGNGLSDMVVDKQGYLYLLLAPEEEAAAIVKFHLNSKTEADRYEFPNGIHPQQIRIHNETLYYMDESVYSVDLNTMDLPGSTIIPADGRLFYNMEINPENGDIYMADAVDYVQNGWVYVYNALGEEKDRFEVNSIPGGIYFYNVLAPF